MLRSISPQSKENNQNSNKKKRTQNFTDDTNNSGNNGGENSKGLTSRTLIPLLVGQVLLENYILDSLDTFEQLLNMELDEDERLVVIDNYYKATQKFAETKDSRSLERLNKLLLNTRISSGKQAFFQAHQYNEIKLKFLAFNEKKAQPLKTIDDYKVMASLFIDILSSKPNFFDSAALAVHYVYLFKNLEGYPSEISELDAAISPHIPLFKDIALQEEFYKRQLVLNPNDIDALLEILRILSGKINAREQKEQIQNTKEEVQAAKEIHEYLQRAQDALANVENENMFDDYQPRLQVIQDDLKIVFENISPTQRSLNDWKYIEKSKLKDEDRNIIFQLILEKGESVNDIEIVSRLMPNDPEVFHDELKSDKAVDDTKYVAWNKVYTRLLVLHQMQCHFLLERIITHPQNPETATINTTRVTQNMNALISLFEKKPNCSIEVKALFNTTKFIFASLIALFDLHKQKQPAQLMITNEKNPAIVMNQNSKNENNSSNHQGTNNAKHANSNINISSSY